jgi:hypothetical protein
MMNNQISEVLPRSADELWGLAKDRKKTQGAGKERTDTGVSEHVRQDFPNRLSLSQIPPRIY